MVVCDNTCKYYSRCKASCKNNPEEDINIPNQCYAKTYIDLFYKNAGLDLNEDLTLRYPENNVDREGFDTLKFIDEHFNEFVQKGKSLYLHSSNCGNGKSTWGKKLIKSYCAQRVFRSPAYKHIAVFVNVPEFLNKMKTNISYPIEGFYELLEDIKKSDLVVWDDIGTKTASEFDKETLLSLIEGRRIAKRCNIFTSNLSNQQLVLCLGDRLASRIANSDFNIEFASKDARGNNSINI